MNKHLSSYAFGLCMALGMTFTACSSDKDDAKYKPHTITFEDVAPEYLAGPTAYGENLYPNYKGEDAKRYIGYLDVVSGLNFCISSNDADYGGFGEYGVAISQWNDKEKNDYKNQCSVYFGDSNKKNGGYKNSSTFAVVHASSMPTENPFMKFDEGEELVSHMYITNSTYGALIMLQGNDFSKKLSYENKDWLKLIIVGKDQNGKETGFVEHFLADFRTKTAKGISTTWERVDLKRLGRVHEISFKMEGSDSGEFGLNTPSYFCMDDLTVLLEK